MTHKLKKIAYPIPMRTNLSNRHGVLNCTHCQPAYSCSSSEGAHDISLTPGRAGSVISASAQGRNKLYTLEK